MKLVYLDHGATTPVHEKVLEEIVRVTREFQGNPSSIHTAGIKAREIVENSRKTVARVLNCDPREIIFTGGGSESDNLAIKGIAFRNRKKGKHLITSAFEHPAVKNTFAYLKADHDFDVTVIPVDKEGLVDPGAIDDAIRQDTTLVSVMFANNEIGTIQPVKEIAEICKERGVYYHTDAVQAFCKVPIDLKEIPVDLLAASGHKINGPKGVGMLFVRNGGIDPETGERYLDPLIHGGGHEFGLRAGTENVPGIAGFAKAVEIAASHLEAEARRQTALRDRIIHWFLENVEGARLNGHPTRRLPNNVNVSIPRFSGRVMLLDLDMDGICVSTGSACSSKKSSISHVLAAIGLDEQAANGSLRITLGTTTTEEDVDYFLQKISEEIKFLENHRGNH